MTDSSAVSVTTTVSVRLSERAVQVGGLIAVAALTAIATVLLGIAGRGRG